MTDPAQVTEPVSWWQGALGGGTLVAFIAGLFGWLTKRTEVSAQVEVAQVQAQTSREADVTGQHRIATEAAAQVEVAHTQAETQAEGLAADMLRDEREGHNDCREEVRELRAELTTFAVALAKCEGQHEHATQMITWLEEQLKKLSPETARRAASTRPRPPTPPNGTDIVRPVARKDTRREEPPLRQPTPANGIDVARIPVARRDPRREP